MLKQSTAANVMVFMTDAADHVAGKASLTLTITASKDGAAFASISPTVTERGNGWYSLALTTAHTDTIGDLALHVTGSGADPSDLACRVIALDYADALAFGMSRLDKNVSEVSVVATGAALNVRAASFTLTTGSVAGGTYTSTFGLDGVKHVLNDAAGTLDCYYETSIGIGRVPVSATVQANASGGNDPIGMYGYNWVTTSWDQIATVPGSGGTAILPYTGTMFKAMVGTGANAGKVRVRFFNTGLTSATFSIDQFWVSYAPDSTQLMYSGVAASGGASTITLSSDASAVDDYYKPALLVVRAGTGAGQSRRVDSYVGATRVATVATAWVTAPDSTSEIDIYPWASVRVSDMDNGVITVAQAPNLDAALSSRSTYAGGDTSGITTLLSRLTSGRATNLDSLDAAISTRAAAGADMGLTAGAIDQIWDEVIEAAYTGRQLMRLLAAAAGGKASGLDLDLPKYRDLADTKNRIDAVTDANGNRSAVTLNLN